MATDALAEEGTPADRVVSRRGEGGGGGFFGSLGAETIRRPLVRAALAVLALLYASAIYAPLFANGRPYLLEAIDLAGFDSARRTLVPVARAFAGVLALEPEAWQARRLEGSDASHAQAVEAEARALAARIALIRSHLAASDVAVERCARELEDVRGSAREGDLSSARESAARLVAGAEEARAALGAIDLALPEHVRERLRPARSWPLFTALSPHEVFWMIAWAGLAVLAWRRSRRRSPPRSRAARSLPRALALVLGLSLLGALAPWILGDGGAGVGHVSYRQAIARGELAVERAWFPPVPLGFAETNLAEAYAPPAFAGAASGRGEAEESPEQSEPRAPLRRGEPRAVHWLGTDSLGRDLLARLLWGGRTSLVVGLAAALLLSLLGTAVGLAAGHLGGATDLVLSRAIEVVASFPTFLLVLLVAAASDPETLPPLLGVTLVIALVGWTGVARLARAEALRLRDADFVVAARALGFSGARTIARHVLPNALGPVIVAASFAVGAGVLIESALSYLGFGISAPVPSWGSLINDSRHAEHWWIHLFPGLAIFATVVSFNVIGEGLRDALDPRTRAVDRRARAPGSIAVPLEAGTRPLGLDSSPLGPRPGTTGKMP